MHKLLKMRAGQMDKAQQPRCIMWTRTTLLLSLLRTGTYNHHHATLNATQHRPCGVLKHALDSIGARRPKMRGWEPDDGWVHDVGYATVGPGCGPAKRQRRKKSRIRRMARWRIWCRLASHARRMASRINLTHDGHTDPAA